MADTDEVERLLDSCREPIRSLARELVATILDRRPDLTPVARFGWRSINFHHAVAKLVCGVFPRKDEVRLVFEHGRLLSNESGLLKGDQRQIRSIYLKPGKAIPAEAIGLLLAEAIALRS
jgi:hypothetical protein